MPAQSRVGDASKIPADSHGAPCCPHVAVGPAVTGSDDVWVNEQPAVRYQDRGVHAACCGPNTWEAANGSDTVYINGRPAHRVGDDVTHCGGAGQTIEGSPNVVTGGAKASVVLPERPPAPHDVSYTVKLRDALGRELLGAIAVVRCPHLPVRTIQITGTHTLTGLCDGTTIEVQHQTEKARWHLEP